jgi:hypothetical protein
MLWKQVILLSFATTWIMGQETTLDLQDLLKPFDEVCQLVSPNVDGKYADNADPQKVIFSIPMEREEGAPQEIRYSVDKDLPLKYSSLIRKICEDSTPNSDGKYVLSEAISLINPYKPTHFARLIELLYAYDQNPIAYKGGRHFEIDPNDVYGVLELALFLFSDNKEFDRSSIVISEDRGFFTTLIRSTAFHIFPYPSLLAVKEGSDQQDPFSLTLPHDLYEDAIQYAPASAYVFLYVLQALKNHHRLYSDGLFWLDKLEAHFTLQINLRHGKG